MSIVIEERIAPDTPSANKVVLYAKSDGLIYAKNDTGSETQLSMGVGAVTFTAGTELLPSITTLGDTNTGIYFPAADTIGFTEGGAESMRINSSGNVGIGTASPGTALEVSRSAVSTNVNLLTLKNSAYNVGESASLLFAHGGAPTSQISSYLPGANQTNLIFYTSNTTSTLTEAVRINGSGNVGIGTASPGAKLQLNTVTTSTVGQIIQMVALQSADVIRVVRSDTNNSLQFTPSGQLSIGDFAMLAATVITTGPASSTNANLKVTGGNVGNPNLFLQSLQGGGGGLGGPTSFVYFGDNNRALSYIGGTKVNASVSTASSQLVFGTTSDISTTAVTERMRIDSAGNVLVNQTVSYPAYIGISSNWFPRIQVSNAGSAGDTGVGIYNWSSYATELGGGTGIGANLILAHSASNTNGLHVAISNGMVCGRITFNGSDGTAFAPGAYISAAADGQTWAASDCPTRIVFGVTADGAGTPTERMRIDSAGNVGIGTTSPSYLLDVNGNFMARGSKKVFYYAGMPPNYPGTVGERSVVVDTNFTPTSSSTGTDIVISHSSGMSIGHWIATVNFSADANGSGVGLGRMVVEFDTYASSAGALVVINPKLIDYYSQGGTFYGVLSPVPNIAISYTGTTITLTVAGYSVYSTGLCRVQFYGSVYGGAGLISLSTPGTSSSTSWLTLNGWLQNNSSSLTQTNASTYYTNGSASAVIDSSGRVGIGTASPELILDVTPAVKVGVNSAAIADESAVGARVAYSDPGTVSSGDGTGIKFGMRNRAGVYLGQVFETTNKDATAFTIWTGSDNTTLTEKMRIDSSGNVGIGTASPTANFKLTLSTGGISIIGTQAANATGAIDTQSYSMANGTYQYLNIFKANGLGGGTVSQLFGGYFQGQTAASAYTTGEVAGIKVGTHVKGSGSTITSAFGVIVDDQTVGTNNYGISAVVSSGANKWNIYASGTAQNAFAGNVRIGSTVAPTVALDVTGALSASGLVTASGATNGFVTDATNGLALFSGDPLNYNISRSGTDIRIKSAGSITALIAGTQILSVSSTGLVLTGTLSASGVATFAAGTVALPSITTSGDTNTGVYFPAADTVGITNGGVEVARFSSSTLSMTGSPALIRNVSNADGPGLRVSATQLSVGALNSTSIVYSGAALIRVNTNGDGDVGFRIDANANTTNSVVATQYNVGGIEFANSPSFTTNAATVYSAFHGYTTHASTSVGTIQRAAFYGEVDHAATYAATGTSANSAFLGTLKATNTVTVTALRGADIVLATTAPATIAEVTGFNYRTASVGGGATITDHRGIRILPQTVGTNIYGIASEIAAAASRWNLYVSGTAQNYFAGNTMIGATTGSATINTSAGGTVSLGVGHNSSLWTETADGNNTFRLMQNVYYAADFKYNTTGRAAGIYEQNNGIHKWLSAPSGTTGNTATFTESMRINSSGNVGIGTPTPAYSLDVNVASSTTAIRVLGSNTTTPDTRLIVATSGNGGAGRGAAISIQAGGSASAVEVVKLIGLQETASATADNASFAIQVANTSGTLTERMRIDSAGNVLITGSSAVTLEVKALINTAAALKLSSTGGIQAGMFMAAPIVDSSLGFQTAGTERMRILSAGTVLIGKTSATANGGDVQVSSGITFPATQVPKSDANTLDDYEEKSLNSFIPTLTFGGGSVGMTTSSYRTLVTKIGAVVTYWVSITLSAKGSSTGTAVIGNLPYVSWNDGETNPDAVIGCSNLTFSGHLFAKQINNSTNIVLYNAASGGAATPLTDTAFANNTTISVSGHYWVQH